MCEVWCSGDMVSNEKELEKNRLYDFVAFLLGIIDGITLVNRKYLLYNTLRKFSLYNYVKLKISEGQTNKATKKNTKIRCP